tara:strand:+ start:3245 stop:4030 length:786 start_codon:yes stop_codon:yes gene_type:complete
MAFKNYFKNWIPTQWKTKMPDGFNWEVHNLVAYKEKKEKFVKGEISWEELREFEKKYGESQEQREFRWQQHHQRMELDKQIASDFQNWKHYGKDWLHRMMDKGRHLLFSKWWWTKPRKMAGKGRMKQSPITGGWSQEYVPDKSMNVRAWLAAANTGNAFKGKKNFNPDTLKLKEPTPDMLYKSNEAKKERARQRWELIMSETNNFGKGFHTIDRSKPGLGGGQPRQVRVTFSDERVYGGRDRVSSIKKKTKKGNKTNSKKK